MDKITKNNQSLFDEVRGLKLKDGQYAITGSGPLGIRGIRKMADIDILVSDKYWDNLKSRGEIIRVGKLTKLKLSENIEVLFSGSFKPRKDDLPSIGEQIKKAELIDGLRFVCLGHLKLFKSLSARGRDKKDLILMESLT